MRKTIPAVYEDGVFKPLRSPLKINLKDHAKVDLIIVKPLKTTSSRIKVAEDLCNINAPVADWDQMEQEIEKGFLK